MAIRLDTDGKIVEGGDPLIPDVAGLTEAVLGGIPAQDRKIVRTIQARIKETRGLDNIETILTQIRRLAQAIDTSTVNGLNGEQYDRLAGLICEQIGKNVRVSLPPYPNAYSELVSWIAGTFREHSVEIFTPNYDLLMEEAFERSRVPYFDGFSGSHRPFFDPASVSSDELPARWSRLWKLHGSLGWAMSDNTVVRTGRREATELIYPDHLKYDQVRRLPYSALFERLRQFLTTPDTLLICSGFSFLDAHICAVLDEALAANAHTAILAFQYRVLSEERAAAGIAYSRPNLSVYARDGAIISGVAGAWRSEPPANEELRDIRHIFWSPPTEGVPGMFMLGDFAKLAKFLALTQARELESPELGLKDDQAEGSESPPSGERGDA